MLIVIYDERMICLFIQREYSLFYTIFLKGYKMYLFFMHFVFKRG
jgi:hypothetical protein